MISHFLKYYRPYMALFYLDFGSAFVMACLDLVFPVAVRKVIDEILPAASLQLLLMACAGLLLMYGFRAVLEYIVNYWGHVLGVRMEYDMRRDMFDHIQKLSFSYFDNTKTGHIMSRLVSDLNEISELAHHGPEDLFTAVVTLGGSLLVLMTFNWRLALITFSLVPFMFWFAIIKNRKMRAFFREVRVKIADINAQAEDSVSGIRVVKSFANEWYEAKKFDRGNVCFKNTREAAFKLMAEFYAGINLFTNLFNTIVLLSGGLFVYYGILTIGELMGFLLYVAIFLQPVRKISNLMEAYQKGMAGFRRFKEVMDLEPDITDSPDSVEVKDINGRITFEKVTFSYNNRCEVLKDVNLDILPGETVAFVGPSGGGKTTLCSLIPRFYDVVAGRILIDGFDIRSLKQKSLRQNIGIVQQDVFLFSDTIRENIAYGKIGATDEEIVEAAKRANAHDFIISLEEGYDTYTGERGVKLSGGQKQRLAIARMFLKNPPILILDEATSALDTETEKVIQEALYKLAENRTTLVIAHRLTTIKSADRIVVITEQGIVEQGTHTQLLARDGLYARLYSVQYDGFIPDQAYT